MFFKKQLLLAALFALALFGAAPDHARAQGCGQQNPNCIVPTAPVGTSNNQAASTAFVQNQLGHGIPYTAVTGLPADTILGSIAGGVASALTPTQVTTFCNVFSTALSGCVPAPLTVSGRYLGDDHGWHAAAVQQILQGAGITLTGTCSGAALNCTVATSSSAQLLLASRALAVTQNLSAVTAVQTLGYATSGDGGGATFKNVGTMSFIDSNVTNGSITSPGSGCTNGTTYRVQLTGGTGRGFYANVTASGGVVTTVQIAENGGNAYTINDVLTGAVTGCTFTWTVSGVSTALASFTDSVGTHFQYVVDAGNYINSRQFGVKADFSTIDRPSIQAAINFADFQNYASASNACAGGGGSCGATVLLPAGTMVIDNTLTVFDGVELRGQGEFNSGLLLGSSFPAGNDAAHLCDINIQLACFGAKITNLSITSPASLTATTSYLVNSVSVQQTTALEHVALYSLDQRGCLTYTHGYGGAAKVNFYDLFCTITSASTSDGIVINPTTTVNISFDGGLIVESPSYSGNAIDWLSGNMFINGFHTEGIAAGISANATVSTYQASLRGATGGSGCTQLVSLQSTNTPGNFSIGTSQKNGCTRLVTDGQSGGGNQTADQVLDKVFLP